MLHPKRRGRQCQAIMVSMREGGGRYLLAIKTKAKRHFSLDPRSSTPQPFRRRHEQPKEDASSRRSSRPPWRERWRSASGIRNTFWASLAVAGAGLPPPLSPHLLTVVIGLALIAVGTFFAQATATGFISRSPTTDRGAASGMSLASYYLGGLAARRCWAKSMIASDGRLESLA